MPHYAKRMKVHEKRSLVKQLKVTKAIKLQHNCNEVALKKSHTSIILPVSSMIVCLYLYIQMSCTCFPSFLPFPLATGLWIWIRSANMIELTWRETHSAFYSHIWSRQATEGNYTSGYPVIRSWKIFHILQPSSVVAASYAADNYPTTLSYRVGCYLRALSTRPINKRWDWKMVNQLPMTLTSFMVTFSNWLVCELLFFVAFVAARFFTVGVNGSGYDNCRRERGCESDNWDAGWGHSDDIISFQI